MPRIAKRTNRTRDRQRPPRLSPAVNTVILASLGFVKAKPANTRKVSKKKGGSAIVDLPKTTTANRPATSSQPEVNREMDAKEHAANNQPAANNHPAENNQPAGKQPADDRTGAVKPSADGEQLGANQKPGVQKAPTAGNSPHGENRPAAREEPNMQDQQAPKPPQVQNKNYNQPGTPPPNIDRRLPSGLQRPIYSLPEKKTHPDPAIPSEAGSSPESPAPNNPAASDSTGETHQAGMPGAEKNNNSVRTNGNETPKNGMPANGNGSTLSNRYGAPTNGHNGKAPGLNGSNGHSHRTSLFQAGAYTSMPAVRIPPKAGGSAQKPPAITQLPMETSPRMDEEREAAFRNENAAEPEPQPQPPVTPPSFTQQKPPITNATPGSAARTTGLENLFKQNENLPDQAVVFGVCDDGLPVLLNLQDPTPGAVVVIGNEREAQLEFLRTAIASVAGRNSPRSMQFLVFSCDPNAWKKWVVEKGFERHCLTIESADEGLVREWIIRLADWTEQRRLGQSSGPAVLLVMDTLSFLTQLAYDVRLNFDWMAKEGPLAQIWPLAVISTDLAKALSGRRMLRGFQTRIIGYANQPAEIMQLAGVDAQEAEALGHQGEFAVKVGETWLRFKLPG